MKSQYYWRYEFNFDLLNYLTNYSHFLWKPGFFSHFIFDDRPISLEAPSHFGKNTPVLHISEKNALGSFIQE